MLNQKNYILRAKRITDVEIDWIIENIRLNLEAVPGKHSIDSLQKTAILGTSHIIRKVLQCEA